MNSNRSKAKSTLPQVSVIIPFYNAEDYIEQCALSVIDQSLKNIEIIFIDDGSTDNSSDIIKKFQKKDSRIKLIDKEHSNAGDARNEGLKTAKGEFLSFVDADDFIEPDMLEKAYYVAEEQCAEIVHFRSDMYDDVSGKFIESPWTLREWEMPKTRPFSASDATEKVFNMGSCTPWDKLFRRSFILENNIEFQSVTSSNDMLFTFGALSLAGCITTVDDLLYHMRVGHRKYLAENAENMSANYFKALLGLKHFLEERGLYEQFKKSFLNWAADFSLWNYNRLQDPFFRDIMERYLKYTFLEELGVYELPEEEYYNHELYEQIHKFKEELISEALVKRADKPKVSVIIPVYNAEERLSACLERVVHQTLRDIEIICVNDGSEDNSIDIIKRFASSDDRFIILENRKKLGHGSALNKGLEVATGDYVCFVEPFDLLSVSMTKKLFEAAERKKLDIARGDVCRLKHDQYGDIIIEYNNVALSGGNYNRVIDTSYDRVWRDFYNVIWGAIYNKDFLTSNSITFSEEEDSPLNDEDFVFKGNITSRRTMYIPEPFYYDTIKSYLFSGYGMMELL